MLRNSAAVTVSTSNSRRPGRRWRSDQESSSNRSAGSAARTSSRWSSGVFSALRIRIDVEVVELELTGVTAGGEGEPDQLPPGGVARLDVEGIREPPIGALAVGITGVAGLAPARCAGIHDKDAYAAAADQVADHGPRPGESGVDRHRK